MDRQAFVAENARLRAEIQALRNANVALQPPAYTTAVGEQVFRFLDLPKDIRLIVYEFALCRGRVTLRINASRDRGALRLARDRRYPGASEPTYGATHLFAVCKQIKDESLGLYLRELCITLTYRDSDPHELARQWSLIDFPRHAVIQTMALDVASLERLAAHLASQGAIGIFWRKLMAPVAANSRLKRFVVDVEEAYCPGGCCRMWCAAVLELFVFPKWATQPGKVEIVGALPEEAKAPFSASAEWDPAATSVLFRGLAGKAVDENDEEDESGAEGNTADAQDGGGVDDEVEADEGAEDNEDNDVSVESNSASADDGAGAEGEAADAA